jgi:hypothetical protein
MKTLELIFENEQGKSSRITLDQPVELVDTAKINAALSAVVTANIFSSSGGDFVKATGARIVERNVTDIVLS